ncbi:MAG: hypothetical protein FJ109_19780 [Deltaproteobacteria bacterium]|nr:hypothetical protein [Deltaproteobacteria bacterium]
MKRAFPPAIPLLLFLPAMACGNSSDNASDIQDGSATEVADQFADALQSDTGDGHGELSADAAGGESGCVPACEKKGCGPDGCGGNCGQCGGLQVCLGGVCCSPACDGLDCGPDGCGGSCGQCDEGAVCLDGLCCEAACNGKNCGPDGCGGSCGQCGPDRFCMDGVCSEPDQDYDGVPDVADLFPQNPGLPGTVKPSTVYAHTADTLYAMDVKMYKLDKVGDFAWPNDGATHKMTDIGIDSYGVLYGTSYEYLYTCHPETVQCSLVAKLPSAFNGLTMVPAGLIDPDQDVLIGISEEGGWYRLDLVDGELAAKKLGGYGAQYASAGDAYSIAGVGTFAAVHKDGEDSNLLVSVDPATGHVASDIGPISGYVGIFGLAGWTDKAFAFDKTGDVLLIDTGTAEVKLLHDTQIPWWGAGVKTKLE